jgi:hypothetical protein
MPRHRSSQDESASSQVDTTWLGVTEIVADPIPMDYSTPFWVGSRPLRGIASGDTVGQ